MKHKRQILIWSVIVVLLAIGSFILFNQPKTEIITFSLVADNLTSPVKLIQSPDDTGRLFVVDRTGIIKIIQGNQTMEEPFLDIRDRLVDLKEEYDERGLLGLAFSPNFEKDGKFFVYYSAPLMASAPEGWDHTSRVSEFSVSANNPNKANANSEKIILQIDEPQFNHDGGELVFGPDGYLYISTGDGGNADDFGLGHPDTGNAQDKETLLGKILRIDMNGSVPTDNPFVGKAGLDEIYAYGFRNPFRMSFDVETGKLFVADVGQNLWEEIDIVEKGKDYGWNIREGTHCFSHDSPDKSPSKCSDVGYEGEELIEPILEYGHSVGLSVIGGFVYRGDLIPEWKGKYIFGDWSNNFLIGGGKIFVAEEKDGTWKIVDKIKVDSFVLGFAEDNENELYILTSGNLGPSGNNGKVYKIVRQV